MQFLQATKTYLWSTQRYAIHDLFSTTDTFTFCLFSLCFSICTNKKFVVVQQRHFWNSASLRPSFSLNCCFLLSYFKTSTTKTEETFFRDLSYLCERNVGIVPYMWPGFYEFMKIWHFLNFTVLSTVTIQGCSKICWR